MDVTTLLCMTLAVAAAALLSAKLLSAPLRVAWRALLNTLLGLIALLAVNAAGSVTGLTLGVNLFNAAVVGILGIPGLGLLFLLQWVLT